MLPPRRIKEIDRLTLLNSIFKNLGLGTLILVFKSTVEEIII
jgi:hypothetical protein